MTDYTFRDGTPNEYLAILASVKTHFAAFLSQSSASELATKRVRICNEAGAAYLLDNGDLQGLINASGNGAGKAAIRDALANGAKTLDCYDGYLPTLYQSFGFAEYDRLQWDTDYAPATWDYNRYGTPDVVMMRIN